MQDCKEIWFVYAITRARNISKLKTFPSLPVSRSPDTSARLAEQDDGREKEEDARIEKPELEVLLTSNQSGYRKIC